MIVDLCLAGYATGRCVAQRGLRVRPAHDRQRDFSILMMQKFTFFFATPLFPRRARDLEVRVVRHKSKSTRGASDEFVRVVARKRRNRTQ